MTPSENLSIAELVIYPPILIANIFVLIRHGISRQSGWMFLAIFCLIRIIGAAMGVAYGKTHDTNDLEWSAILGSIGISPLLMATAGLLQRVIDATVNATSTCASRQMDGEKNTFQKIIPFVPVFGQLYRILYSPSTTTVSHRSRLIQLIHLPAIIALIICIVGGTDTTSSSPSDRKQGTTMLKAGIIIFLIIYILLLLLAGYSASEFNNVPSGEKRILAVILAALPLIAVRILWSILAYFGHFSQFNVITGSVVVRAFMSILEEFLVVIMYTVAGLMVPPAYQADVRGTEMGAQGKYNVQGSEMEAQRLPKYQAAKPSR